MNFKSSFGFAYLHRHEMKQLNLTMEPALKFKGYPKAEYCTLIMARQNKKFLER